MPLGRRWTHTLGVVERASALGDLLTADDLDVLTAAAYVHDLGYALSSPAPASTLSTRRTSCDAQEGSSSLAWWRTIRVPGRKQKSVGF
jgi:HD superfamily phosphohydrolase YqeK